MTSQSHSRGASEPGPTQPGLSKDHVLLDGDPNAMMRAALAAYKRAVKRHFQLVSIPGGREASIFVALGESLFWAVAIDEMLARRDGYVDRRNRDPRAEFFPGLKLARNQLTHAVGIATVRAPAPFFIKAGGLFHLGNGWIWRDVELLPAVPGFSAPKQRANYAEHLQGRLTYETLALVSQWFTQEASSISSRRRRPLGD